MGNVLKTIPHDLEIGNLAINHGLTKAPIAIFYLLFTDPLQLRAQNCLRVFLKWWEGVAIVLPVSLQCCRKNGFRFVHNIGPRFGDGMQIVQMANQPLIVRPVSLPRAMGGRTAQITNDLVSHRVGQTNNRHHRRIFRRIAPQRPIQNAPQRSVLYGRDRIEGGHLQLDMRTQEEILTKTRPIPEITDHIGVSIARLKFSINRKARITEALNQIVLEDRQKLAPLVPALYIERQDNTKIGILRHALDDTVSLGQRSTASKNYLGSMVLSHLGYHCDRFGYQNVLFKHGRFERKLVGCHYVLYLSNPFFINLFHKPATAC